ncbi:NTP transferase domain-containing protein [Altererythrobacter aurantiacus]|uniref:NTP transferase domain-containing protein n=1 Tax=Parapontixanthobacter aurantiacus TaxID=1463599 RepID=A0A844ZC58_9SPHN|nr:NTP transferase domain-containing protein [Parapontixanthobacter aurantiacus]
MSERFDRTGLILLASGQSKRFGGPKLDALLGGRPLWHWAAETCERTGFGARFLVLDKARKLAGMREKWVPIENGEAAEGIASSIRQGVRAAANFDRVVLCLADMPFVSVEHLGRLAATDGVVFSRQASGAAGVPAAFPNGAFVRLLSLRGDRGAGSLEWPDCKILLPASDRELFDIDTEKALNDAEAMIKGG